METFAPIALLLTGPLLVAVFTAVNAKKTNAKWRERRTVRLAARHAFEA